MKKSNGLIGILIIWTVWMGGPIAALGKETPAISCSGIVKAESSARVECGNVSLSVKAAVDSNRSKIGPTKTLSRTESSGQFRGNSDMPNKVRELIEEVSLKLELNPRLLKAVAMAESGGKQEAVSRAGAVGVMQLMPGIARGRGVNPYDVEQNILGGGLYLKRQLERHNGNIPLALAAYNAGPGNVQKYGGIPPFTETEEYISRVLANMGRD